MRGYYWAVYTDGGRGPADTPVQYRGQEYSGIEVGRLEQMEARLKADVLREAEASGGRLLVAREQARPGVADDGSEIIDVYEPIAGARGVPCCTGTAHVCADARQPHGRDVLVTCMALEYAIQVHAALHCSCKHGSEGDVG